ncbi:MAG: MBL fold metallo-hydrolase [Thermotogota bacterium]
MKYVEIKNNIGYIASSTNIGIIIDGTNVLAIDTGLDKRSSSLILKFLEKNNLHLEYLLNTHSHSDHTGGNYYLQKETNCKIITPDLEDYFVQNQFLKPYYIYSGTKPPRHLTNKFMQSKDSKVFKTLKKGELFSFGGIEIKAIDLNGHTFNHLGYLIEGVLFSGDTLIGENKLSKTKMSYYIDVENLLKSFNTIENLEFDILIPSHGSHSYKNKEIVDFNREKVAIINRLIIDNTREDISEEDLFSKVFDELGMKIRTLTEYYLMKPTLMSHISYLNDKKRLKIIVKNNKIYYNSQ